ncbi:MAG: hypothetical protein GY811_00855 [Myxococcales bacterium]|nr:hypothetical protein [Myxococcales bacterium]
MSKDDESVVQVTMRPASAGADAVAEWETESAGGDETTVDAASLAELPETPASTPTPEAAAFAEAAGEFDSVPATVMESVSREALLEAVDKGGFEDGATSEFDDDSVTRMDPRSVEEVLRADESQAKKVCPKCGVVVAQGYPNCPRCKSSLKATTGREHGGAGGTSVVGRTIPWAIVLIAAVLTAIIVYLAEWAPVISGGEASGAETSTEGVALPPGDAGSIVLEDEERADENDPAADEDNE